jgi:hypothetical protein
MKKRSLSSPPLVLFVLSPMIGELLSGSAPPAEFFNPAGFVVLAMLYGGGAILARELTHRWGKGWPTLLVLGAAYGIAEEGLMCKSFFDPNWMDLGALGSYGRWAGVNWVWAVELTIYHAAFSIAIPVLLVSVMFATRRREAWLSRRKFYVLLILWLVNGILIFFFIGSYRPPLVHYLLTIMIMIGLCVIARGLPHPMFVWDVGSKKAAHPFWFFLIGFAGTLGLFFLAWVLPHTALHPLLTMLMMAGLVCLVSWAALKMSCGAAKWTEKHQLALVSGALAFFILLTPLQELDNKRTDNTTGMSLVGLAAVIFLIWMARRTKHIEESKTECIGFSCLACDCPRGRGACHLCR